MDAPVGDTIGYTMSLALPPPSSRKKTFLLRSQTTRFVSVWLTALRAEYRDDNVSVNEEHFRKRIPYFGPGFHV